MLQSISAAQLGMADRVCEDEPGRCRRELPESARGTLLELGAVLQEMVQSQHVDVIGRAPGYAGLEQAQQSLPKPVRPPVGSRARQTGAAAILLKDTRERV